MQIQGAEEDLTTASLVIADHQGMMSSTLDHVAGHLTRLLESWSLMPQRFNMVREVVMTDVGGRGGVTVVALTVLFVGVGAILSYAAYRLARPLRLWTIVQDIDSPRGRVGKFGGRFLVGMLMLVAFMVGSAGAFVLFEWPPLVREIVLVYLTAAISIWAIRIITRLTLIPSLMGVVRSREVRALDISDAQADHWSFWIVVFSSFVGVTAATISLAPRLGFTPDDVLALAVPVDLALLAITLKAFWQRPLALAENNRRRGLFGRSAMSWLVSVYLVILFLLRVSGSSAAFWFAVAAVVAPVAIIITTQSVNYVLRPPLSESNIRAHPAIMVAVIDRAIRLGIIILTALFLAKVSDLDMTNMAENSSRTSLILRGFLNVAVISLGADLIWSILRAAIQQKIAMRAPVIMADGGVPPAIDAHEARLRTLLPILQNILLAVIVVMTILMILSSVGIQIGPLIAGAGVVGVAVGFGAQTIVKDVISGVFYLLDDAFRVGEHISTGTFSGTVESFSLRSIKLRHHRGPLYTIPFGELGAVRNGSRDWSIDKFNITVGFDTDLEFARKLIKRLGLELAEDPEYKPWIIDPIKLQGVQEFGEYGIVLRIKTTTRPGGAFGMKRKFFIRVREIFKQNGIELPVPTVHIQSQPAGALLNGSDNEAAAVQAYLQHKKKDQLATEEEP